MVIFVIVANEQVHLFLDRSLLLEPLVLVPPKLVHSEALFNSHSTLLIIDYLFHRHLVPHKVNNVSLLFQARWDFARHACRPLVLPAIPQIVLQSRHPFVVIALHM